DQCREVAPQRGVVAGHDVRDQRGEGLGAPAREIVADGGSLDLREHAVRVQAPLGAGGAQGPPALAAEVEAGGQEHARGRRVGGGKLGQGGFGRVHRRSPRTKGGQGRGRGASVGIARFFRLCCATSNGGLLCSA